VSLAMRASKYGGGNRGDMRGFTFGPPAGTTTYGGSGFMGVPMGRGGPGTMRIGPGGGVYGDPGLLDFFGGVVKKGLGVVGGLGIPGISGAANIARGFLNGGARGPGITPLFDPGGTPFLQQSRFQQGGGTPIGIRKRGFRAGVEALVPGGATGMGAGCGSGYRPNKSGYYVNGGQFVEPGSVCVKRRRMNPLNPRALSKAMRRIESAKRATPVLGRITIRKKC